MKTGLKSPAPGLQENAPFEFKLRADCELREDEGWQDAMVSVNRLLDYVLVLEERIRELEQK